MQQIDALEKLDIKSFQNDLITWFEQEQRILPWREDSDPYKIWVSEIMLQQTRVDTVIPYFNRFMEWFPTLEDFAEADEEKILKAWEGLGYYSRVRNLQSAIKEVKEHYGGKVPNNHQDMIALKGVGPYTAGAVLSIAYGLPEPAVDGNVMRVLSRILLIQEDIAKQKTRNIFEDAVRLIISHKNPSSFNQALMELGALICTPGTPSCLLCPVNKHCVAFSEGVQADLPVKTVVKKVKKIHLISCIIINEKGEILVRKRPPKGLLANLWEFPSYSNEKAVTDKEEYTEMFAAQFETKIELSADKFTEIQHVFSHLKWNIDAYTAKLQTDIPDGIMEINRFKWVTDSEMNNMAFPVPYQKMFQSFKELME